MSDAVCDGHSRVWRVLAGPATEVAGAIVALPAELRVAVLRSLLAARPRREDVTELAPEVRRQLASLFFVEHVLQALETHAEGGERAVRSLVGDWLARADGWVRRWRWLALRTLVRARLLAAPDHVEYQKGMWALGGARAELAAELRGDPELLGEPLWRLFALEGDREYSFANVDKYAGGEHGKWLSTLVELANTGEVDRQRLLREALAALQRDFPAYRATWFARLYDALEPTAAERGGHLGQYVRIVASRIPQVQAFGVRALAAAAKDGAALPFAQLDELEPAWTARQKGVVIAALRLAASMARAEPPALPRIAGAMAKALGHPRGDVQLAAWQELQRLALPGGTLRELVAPFAAALSPRVAKLAAPVLGGDAAAALPPVRTTAPAAATPTAATAVVPIASFDELVRELTALVAGADDPLVLERCLDGVVRHAGERPADFDRRIAGLRKLARRDQPRRFQPFVRAWLDGRELGENEGLLESEWSADLVALLQPRLREVLQLARRAAGLPLLALPTHAPFWIDGDELRQRLDRWTRANVRPAEHDLAQALRRVPASQRAAVRRGLPVALSRRADAPFAAPPEIVPAPTMRWDQLRDGTRCRRRDVRFGDVREAPTHPVARCFSHVPEGSLQCESVSFWRPDESETPLLLRSLAGLAPNDIELLCALAVPRVGFNVDGHTVARGDVAFLEPLLWPATAPGPNAHLLLAIALGARAPEMCGLAIDVVLAMLGDGRLRVGELASALRTLLAIRFVAGARWAKSLRTIADAGDAAPATVFALLDGMLAGPADDAARELGELLALAVDLAATSGRRITSPDAVELLRAVAASGTGRASTLARELLPAGDVPAARARR